MFVPRSSPMPHVITALQRGQWQEALRLLVDPPDAATGARSAAPDARPAPHAGQPAHARPIQAKPAAPHAVGFGMPAPLPPAVTDALAQGKKLEAIRLLRQQQGLGLREAKERVEEHIARHMDAMPHLAPGQVDDNATGSFVLLVAVLLGFGAYWYFKG